MADSFSVDIRVANRSGTVRYSEPGRGDHTFDCEFGGGNTVLVVYAPFPQKWDAELPWAAGRRQEVLERLAHEVILQKARGCRFVVHEGGVEIVQGRF